MNEVYEFLGLPYGEFKNDEIYEQVSEENYLFLKNELPEDKWFESINAIAGLWLIYFGKTFIINIFKNSQRFYVSYIRRFYRDMGSLPEEISFRRPISLAF